jgi:hypothetical protein
MLYGDFPYNKSGKGLEYQIKNKKIKFYDEENKVSKEMKE